MSEGLILVRATIHLPGLRVGSVVRVDPSEPYVAECLKAGYLVPLSENLSSTPS